jgi:hypothetical protein
MRYMIRYEVGKKADQFLLWLARKLPKRLVMWCYVVVVAHATTGQSRKPSF